jgi:uncharacterized membrane protein
MASIGDVAKRHNVLLRPDDPILVSITLNELLLARLVQEMKASLIAAQNEIAAGTAQQVAAAKLWSERLVTAGAEYINAEVRRATAQAVEQIGVAVDRKLKDVDEKVEAIGQARLTVLWAAAAALAVMAVATTLAAILPSLCRTF